MCNKEINCIIEKRDSLSVCSKCYGKKPFDLKIEDLEGWLVDIKKSLEKIEKKLKDEEQDFFKELPNKIKNKIKELNILQNERKIIETAYEEKIANARTRLKYLYLKKIGKPREFRKCDGEISNIEDEIRLLEKYPKNSFKIEKEDLISKIADLNGLKKNIEEEITRKEEEITRKEGEERQKLINRVKEAIDDFEPDKKFTHEEPFHSGMYQWLKAKFPNARIEHQRGSSRPDIVIDEIAIEIKGPTGDLALNSIASKCMRYSEHFENLIIVLFDVRVTENFFQEWLRGLEKHFPHVIVKRKEAVNNF
ncbi:MAG: hypothetical protein ABIN18_22440 [Pseudomonadota bacterium]